MGEVDRSSWRWWFNRKTCSVMVTDGENVVAVRLPAVPLVPEHLALGVWRADRVLRRWHDQAAHR